jgi:DNA-binding beta-propeller fold protein YncE
MNDTLESLVRETLVDPRRRLDPDPQHYSLVTARVRVLRRHRFGRWASAAAAAATVAVIVGVVSATGPRPQVRPLPPVSSAPGVVSPATLVTGQVVDVTASPDAIFVLETAPDSVVRIDRVGRQVTGTVAVPGDPVGIAVDPVAGRLWVWSRSALREYDLAGLAPLRDLNLPSSEVFAGAALDGDLWLTTPTGLYRVPAGSGVPQQVPGVGAGVYGLTADRARGRIIVSGDQIVAVDPASLAVTKGASFVLGKTSVVAVDGRVWVGGYGSGPGRRVIQLDPVTLQPTGTSPVNEQVGPGAVLWPGASVVWVRNGGDEGLSCVDPTSGAVFQQWREVQGPVASAAGVALANHNGTATWLGLDPSCAG